MKILKRILSVILVIAIFSGSFAGTFFLFSKGTHKIETEYISIFEEEQNAYYLQKADPYIIFRIDVDSSKENSGFSLFDNDGKPVKVKTERLGVKSFNILPPKSGYQAGERYTLLLADNAHFHHESLKNAKKLVFCIDRPIQEKYEFNDSVIELTETINKTEENKIKLSNDSVEKGDIVFGQNSNDEYVAYKISEIAEDGTATIALPAIDEIYSKLDIYGEYEWDVSQLVCNPDLEVEIVENVKKSSFFDALMMTAYADEKNRDGKFDISITPDLENMSLEIKIGITLEPGEKGLFGIWELRNQQVTLTLSAKFGLKTKCNVQGLKNWDISATTTTAFSWEIDISFYNKDFGPEDKELDELFSEKNAFANLIDYHKHASKITEKLNQLSADATSGELKLFDWKLPIAAVPGLYFSAEIKLFLDFNIAAELCIGQETETVYTVGICLVNEEFDVYSNTYRHNKGIQVSLSGKMNVKTGIKLIIKATFIDDGIANINLDPQVGLYADLFVTIPISNKDEIKDNKFLYSYLEGGVYFSASVNATVNLLVKKFEFSFELIEKKFPIDALTAGNEKIAIGLTTNISTVRAVNDTVSLPDILFEYLDVKNGVKKTEKIAYKNLKFYINNDTKLEAKNGKIKLPEATSSSSLYVTATYLHNDGKTYSTMFKVLLSGSILEGKVSAFTSDLTTGELAGANVKLFSSTNKDTPISSVTTDENGKFSFNVSKGNYCLVISADGYRTLTSNQSVAENEIKYTEHILLIDNAHSGMGNAGGKVSNALDGKGLSNVKLKLRADWNNTSGAYIEGFETTTNSSGKYSISNVPVGYYTVEASLGGYVTGYSNIIVLSNGYKEDFDFTITPILSDDEIRIVLTWGSSPSDLDSHLIGESPAGNSFNVYYNSKVYKFEGREMANLDVDDTTSYGPETITILENIYGTYTYAVHDYSHKNSSASTALSFSNAVVRVFMGSTQVAEYHVPTDQIGTYWTVFQIDGSGHILPINSVSNNKPVAE